MSTPTYRGPSKPQGLAGMSTEATSSGAFGAADGGGHSGFAPYADVEGGAAVAIGVPSGPSGGAGMMSGMGGAASFHGGPLGGSVLGGGPSSVSAYSSKPPPPLSAYSKRAGIVAAAGLFLFFVASEGYRYNVFVLMLCGLGALFCLYLRNWLLSKDDGTPEMREVADPIRDGARAFLATQYGAIGRLALVVAAVIFLSYQLRPSDMAGGVNSLSSTTLGLLGAFSFCIGAACSAAAGYVSMLIAAQTNIRVTSAARRGYLESLAICFRGGAFSAVLVLTMCVTGITVLHAFLHTFFVTDTDGAAANGSGLGVEGRVGTGIAPADVPLLTVGYGFGASFVALFMQLGGGIYTKGADVGADMVGKIEQGIPEDDPRNPAVIADLVGDMVGDCVGSSADIFESIAAEIIGAMILAGTLAHEARLTHPSAFVVFPVMVHAFDIVVSSVGIWAMGDGSPRSMLPFIATGSITGGGAGAASSSSSLDASGAPAIGGDLDPLRLMKRGYLLSLSLASVVFAGLTRWLLYEPTVPGAWLHYLLCGWIGMATSYIFIVSTQHFTDYAFEPVRSIAAASTTGHGTNIIAGVAVGMKSTAIPVLAVSGAVIAAYTLGRTSGMGGGVNAGLFGTAVATMGMLSSAGYILAMNNYGPIADNAGGIAEMSQQPEAVRDATDRLDAAGNVTKAITKGYSIGSAALACFLLFGALMDELSAFAGQPFRKVDIATPEVLIGGLLGVMMVFYFVGLSVSAVGRTAQHVVEEVRRQIRESPGIMTFKQKPNYYTCVKLVTSAALSEMRLPGLLTVAMPVGVGMTFRVFGEWTGRPLLGAEVLSSFLMFGTVAGILMALFLDNVGGAWDNAKKYVEMGNFGGKGSEAHKAAVTGDTVGDPFKDTAGPSLHVVIKLLSTTILVLGPLFVARQGGTGGAIVA